MYIQMLILFELQQLILTAELSMSRPRTNFGRTTPPHFNPLTTIWPNEPQTPFNNSFHSQFPFFYNSTSLPYPLPSQSFQNPANKAYFNSSLKLMQARARQFSVTLSIKTLREGILRQNKKKKKSNHQEVIDLISDDEELLQPQKPSQDKNTKNSNKHSDYNESEKPAQKAHPKNKEMKQSKFATLQDEDLEHMQQHKTQKKKEITKKANINKTKTATNVEKKREFISKRIFEKQISKKEPFRVSRRQRQLLQVSYLRQSSDCIMTGPQFQAKLPKFQAEIQERQRWLKQIKSDLLGRQFEQEQQ